jgi:hypothetical protein
LQEQPNSLVRDWVALLIIFVAVPMSVFGGVNVACVGQGVTSSCAPQVVFLSPMVLLISGVLAGVITRGWTGLFVVGVGQIAGQVLIVLLSYVSGRPVPVDLFSGIVATIWFGAPIAIGYGLSRLASRLSGRRRGTRQG